MDTKALKRIQQRNAFFGAQRQSDLIDPHFLSVPAGGFQWTEGFSGPSGARELFLIPKLSPQTSRPRGRMGGGNRIPTDLYLTFSRLQPTPEAALEFANHYGDLGLVPRHFHSRQTTAQSAECWSDWSEEIREFQTCLEGWCIMREQDRPGLLRFMRAHHWPRFVESDDLFVAANLELISRINGKLTPQRVHPEACFRKCKIESVYFVKLTPFVSYWLNFSQSDRPTSAATPVVGRLYPTALVSSLWLQLAELVTGSRFVRRCEKCHQWMDITESPRKGAKRMHENCSLALRMARYRRKKKASTGSGSPHGDPE